MANIALLCAYIIQHTCTLYGIYSTLQTFDLMWFHTIKVDIDRICVMHANQEMGMM